MVDLMCKLGWLKNVPFSASSHDLNSFSSNFLSTILPTSRFAKRKDFSFPLTFLLDILKKF